MIITVIIGSTYPTHLTKLKRLQNKALRIIFKTPIKIRITPQNLKLEILKLYDLDPFEKAKLLCHFIYNKVSSEFNDIFFFLHPIFLEVCWGSSSRLSRHTSRSTNKDYRSFG